MEPTKSANAVMEAITQRMLRNLFTMLPVEILEYDATFQVCTVRPMMKFPYVNGVGDVSYVEPPPIQLVPVAFPGSAASRQTIKLAEGDFGLYIVSTFSIAELLQTDPDLATPADPRTHGLMDGFVLPIDWFLSAKHSSFLTPDRHIAGADVRLGDTPGSAFELAKLSSVQSAIDDLHAKIKLVNLAIAEPDSGTFVGIPDPTVLTAVSPTVLGTNNVRAT